MSSVSAHGELAVLEGQHAVAADRELEVGAIDGAEFLRGPGHASFRRDVGAAFALRARERALCGEAPIAAGERQVVEDQRVVGEASAQAALAPVHAVLRNVQAHVVRRAASPRVRRGRGCRSRSSPRVRGRRRPPAFPATAAAAATKAGPRRATRQGAVERETSRRTFTGLDAQRGVGVPGALRAQRGGGGDIVVLETRLRFERRDAQRQAVGVSLVPSVPNRSPRSRRT